MPSTPEDYVHRIGRTARAGANGVAISLCEPSERLKLFRIEELINSKLKVMKSDFLGIETVEDFDKKTSKSNINKTSNRGFAKTKNIKSLKVLETKTKSIIKRNAKKNKLKVKLKKIERKNNV